MTDSELRPLKSAETLIGEVRSLASDPEHSPPAGDTSSLRDENGRYVKGTPKVVARVRRPASRQIATRFREALEVALERWPDHDVHDHIFQAFVGLCRAAAHGDAKAGQVVFDRLFGPAAPTQAVQVNVEGSAEVRTATIAPPDPIDPGKRMDRAQVQGWLSKASELLEEHGVVDDAPAITATEADPLFE